MRNTSAALPWTLLVALLVFPSSTWAQTATAADDHAARVKRIENGLRPLEPEVMIQGDPTWTLEERMDHYGVPGVGIAVIHEGTVVWHRTYGVTDRETGTPVTTDTLFQAGSVSKPVAAFGALKLVQDGKLTLDGNVNDTLKSWKLPDNAFTREKKVTLTHLLSHTGGLTVHGFPGYALGAPVPSLVQVLDGSGPANTPPIRVDKEPGGSARYSGGGFTVAQQMMIDVTGKPFPEWMQAAVLGPLGMTHSTYENPLPPSLLKHAAAGYLPDKSPVEGKRHTYPEMAAAGLWTTAEDLARFAVEVQQALRGKGKVLSEAMARRMVEPVDRNIGRGLFMGERMQHVYFSHGGWDEGFCAQLTSHRDDGYGVAVMINSNHPGFISEVVRAVAEEYTWGGYHAYENMAMPDNALESYPGRYRYSAEQMFTIQRRGNRLFLEYAGNQPMEMVHVGDGRFVRREKTALITFTKEEGKPVLHFALDDGSHQSHRQMPEGQRALRELVLSEPYEQALAAYRSALKANPEEESLSERELNSWGLRMHEQGASDGAIALLKVNTELYSDSANTYDSVGYVYRQMGRLDQALQWYRKALEVDPDLLTAAKAVVELELERGPAVAHCLAEPLPADSEMGANTITIRALIDGSDVMKVRGNTLWWEHLNNGWPGKWAGDHDFSGNEPTVVNGVHWVPQWDGRISQPYIAGGGLLPEKSAVTVTAVAVSARGKCVVLDQPSEKNGYTLSLMLDDDDLQGAVWYEVQLRW